MKLFPHRKYVFNPQTLMYEVSRPSNARKAAGRISGIVLAIATIAFWFWFYLGVLGQDLPKTALLKRRNASYVSKMRLLSRELDFSERVLSGIEERDDHVYRSIYGMSDVPRDVHSARFSGKYEFYESRGADPGLMVAMRRLDGMSERTYLQSKALDEVNAISKENRDMVSCMPSVPPISPDRSDMRLSSSFGRRVDPVWGGYEYHSGQDFASFIGNPVYATGDGTVLSARTQFKGYGNEIVIDHGFGYKTRYAHLNTIEVNEGMKVSRGERIGTVGSTGKSTGPHLHYEVLYRENRVNPMNYMDMDMSVQEYAAMVKKQSEGSERGKRSSTGDILKRRRMSDEND